MNLKEYFEKIDLDEINRFIIEGQEENLNLEFKTTSHPNYNQHNREDDKKNLSKTLSGFSNSNGGIIVWGIKAKENEKKQDIATTKKPIKELTRFFNTLNRLEGQSVTPVITGIEHKKIEIEEDTGYIITYVPSSDYAPHMANYSNKHYYKRSGDSFYICEHFDIKDMFQRKKSAQLDLNLKDKKINTIHSNQIRIELTLSLMNKGKNYAKAPLVIVSINTPYKFSNFGLDGNGTIGIFHTKALPHKPQSSTYIGSQDIIIYQNLEFDIDKICLEIDKDVEELPELIMKYTIVAVNMEKTNFTKTIVIEK
ncbi:ATP-binding protein [Tenacibaculum sp. IB213877]|uniref:AlbA family DNA-binding domain-containing protein n=1 Tax=Tenacibaculum sp. IB213877 TaxID=3097351 RepID=UPI002A59B769|nr:ATP-binding protein [Tenacibaculum sp. IB213877]MDY0780694.1 ATP-binding protein [Tenacibaculum sp. IB213877]